MGMKEKRKKGLTINIDFDGTCVTHDFPLIGKSIGAEKVLKRLVDNGHQLILFTMRADKEDSTFNSSALKAENKFLSEAIKWFEDNSIPLYGIQKNPTQSAWTSSPKSYANLMIDDSALGCPLKVDIELSTRPFVCWKTIEFMLESMGYFTNEDVEKELFELEQELDIPAAVRWHNSNSKPSIFSTNNAEESINTLSLDPYTHILKTIELIRTSFNGSERVYSNGSCIKFCMILLHIYPKGKILYDLNHAIFEYDNRFYDINGFTKREKNHIPLEDYGLLQAHTSMNLVYKEEKNKTRVMTRLYTVVGKYLSRKDSPKALFYVNKLKDLLESVV